MDRARPKLHSVRIVLDDWVIRAHYRRVVDRVVGNGWRYRSVSRNHIKGCKVIYLPSEDGQGLVEYALILVLVAVVVIAALALLGPALGNIFSNIYVNL